jgi:hypothetical protein
MPKGGPLKALFTQKGEQLKTTQSTLKQTQKGEGDLLLITTSEITVTLRFLSHKSKTEALFVLELRG